MNNQIINFLINYNFLFKIKKIARKLKIGRVYKNVKWKNQFIWKQEWNTLR